MALWLQDMNLELGFSPKAAWLHVREQGLDSTDRLWLITDKNVDDTCNIMRKQYCKNAGGMPDRVQQFSVIAQDNMMLADWKWLHGPTTAA